MRTTVKTLAVTAAVSLSLFTAACGSSDNSSADKPKAETSSMAPADFTRP